MSYVKLSKLKDIKKRQKYIMSEGHGSVILKVNEDFDFTEYILYEKMLSRQQNQHINEGREIMFALPNQWANSPNLEEKCKEIVETTLGKSSDYCFAVRWNKNMTNLHLRCVFSERERIMNRRQARYRKDVWMKEDGTLAKSKAERHFKRHSKGDLKFNADGSPMLEKESVLFENKDIKYKSKGWLHSVKENYKSLLVDKYNIKFKDKTEIR